MDERDLTSALSSDTLAGKLLTVQPTESATTADLLQLLEVMSRSREQMLHV